MSSHGPSKRAVAFALGLVLLGPCAASGAGPTVVKLDAATQQRLGIVTAPLEAARRGATASAFARVLDPTPLASLDADIATAGPALWASRAEAERARALNAADQTVSARAAEAAAAQARADAAKLALLRRRLALEWGPAVAGLPDGARGRLLGEIAAGRAALVRIDAAFGGSLPRGAATLDLGPAGTARAEILGLLRTADARLQSPGLLALVRGPQALRLAAGITAPATLPLSADAAGVVIPRAALLRSGGQTFAYVRRDGAAFERRPLLGAQPDTAGFFVSAGFREGEPVVVKGAAQLFAAEQPARKAD